MACPDFARDRVGGSAGGSVAREASMVYITETNPVSDHPQRHSRRVGLNMHERAVSGIGGSLDAKVDGDVWILKARIPLHSTQSQPV